jgi:hypothetical protein
VNVCALPFGVIIVSSLFVAGDFFLSPFFFFFFFGFIFSSHFWACDPRSSFCELRLHHRRSLFLYFYFCFRRDSILMFDCGIWANGEVCTARDLRHNGPHRRKLRRKLPAAQEIAGGPAARSRE